jgi:HAD superfamily hydrolase (TIGR01509 family)
MFAGSGSRKGFERYFAAQKITDVDGYTAVKVYREKKEKALQERFFEVVTVKPGLELFLEKLKELGKKLAIATSTSRHFAELILDKSGLRQYFDTLVAIEDVQKTKPAPDIFLEALKRLGGVKSETVIFEDSVNGVESAKNSGIEYIVVHTKNNNDVLAKQENEVIFDYISLKV